MVHKLDVPYFRSHEFLRNGGYIYRQGKPPMILILVLMQRILINYRANQSLRTPLANLVKQSLVQYTHYVENGYTFKIKLSQNLELDLKNLFDDRYCICSI